MTKPSRFSPSNLSSVANDSQDPRDGRARIHELLQRFNQLLDYLGDAAALDAGTAVGEVPYLDRSGKLSSSLFPTMQERALGMALVATVAKIRAGTASNAAITPSTFAQAFGSFGMYKLATSASDTNIPRPADLKPGIWFSYLTTQKGWPRSGEAFIVCLIMGSWKILLVFPKTHFKEIFMARTLTGTFTSPITWHPVSGERRKVLTSFTPGQTGTFATDLTSAPNFLKIYLRLKFTSRKTLQTPVLWGESQIVPVIMSRTDRNGIVIHVTNTQIQYGIPHDFTSWGKVSSLRNSAGLRIRDNKFNLVFVWGA